LKEKFKSEKQEIGTIMNDNSFKNKENKNKKEESLLLLFKKKSETFGRV
jgi:hypothetical protein